MKKLFLYTSLIFTVSFVIQLILFRNIISNFFPTGDEIPLLVNSTGLFQTLHLKEWFTEGFSRYFNIYPEWNDMHKNILRPVINVTYYVNSLLFGKNYGYYTLFGYFFNSSGFALVYYYCSAIINSNLKYSLFSCILLFINPSLMSEFFFMPSFTFDVLAGVFAVSVFILICRKKVLFAFILILTSLFLKETCFIIPIASGLSYLFISFNEPRLNKKKLISALIILSVIPLIIYFFFRLITGFEFNASSYTSNLYNPFYFFLSFAEGVTVYPVYFSDKINVINLIKNFPGSGITTDSILVLSSILFNLSVNIFIAYHIIIFFKKKKFLTFPHGITCLLIWLSCLYSELLIFGFDARFSYGLYAFLIPFLLYSLNTSKAGFTKLLIIFSLVAFGISGFKSLTENAGSNKVNEFISKYEYSRKITCVLKSLDLNTKKVYLINDISGGFGTNYLNKFSGIQPEIIKINALKRAGISAAIDNSGITFLKDSIQDVTKINIMINDNESFYFEGVNPVLFKHKEKEILIRNEYIQYFFPEENIMQYTFRSKDPLYNYGNEMDLSIKNSDEKSAVVYYNIEDNNFGVYYLN